MTIEVSVIADSVNPDGERITTIQARYPRFIHAQVLTHRVFSRNAQSSRAMPINRMIEEIKNDPVIPVHWGKNQKGMQANEEVHNSWVAKLFWDKAMSEMLFAAKRLNELGLHKQVANRLLEPFSHISVIITATDWENFFELRCHDDAQPEIQELALTIRGGLNNSVPQKKGWNEWHVPYEGLGETDEEKVMSSVAACARVSYNNHDGSERSLSKDKSLHDMLLSSGHLSPFEHQAYASKGRHDNLRGWFSNRRSK